MSQIMIFMFYNIDKCLTKRVLGANNENSNKENVFPSVINHFVFTGDAYIVTGWSQTSIFKI